ncbi:hypothetical protein JANAI62_11700 [Jannaschia pagri]|uniref:PEP-CTERM protein-sorting domain-containing protein n=1 Tax=Jannaschia pagri TaxID=2829797 RepID=A0ABQ4NJJ0_9RHOB|nr:MULTISPECIES: hypothetical protein [unclassified Jannaschia]GIT90715.1 hypothetical protein JANAI61_11730 [Jannaschia sp. AI_61]GIT94547.1 hypothetical protein JANAI62_11700 [Jannaschia sp. AI_62]
MKLAPHMGDLLGIVCAVAVVLGAVPGLDGPIVGAIALFVLLLSVARIVRRVRQ